MTRSSSGSTVNALAAATGVAVEGAVPMEASTARAEHASAAADAEAAEVVKTRSTSTPMSPEAAAAAAGAQGGAQGRTEPVGEREEVLQTSPAGAQPLGAAPPATQDGPSGEGRTRALDAAGPSDPDHHGPTSMPLEQMPDGHGRRERAGRGRDASSRMPMGRRFWTALRKAPIDPVSNLHVCFAYNQGLIEQRGGCYRGDQCRFAHVSLADIPGGEPALSILSSARPGSSNGHSDGHGMGTGGYGGGGGAYGGGAGGHRMQGQYHQPPMGAGLNGEVVVMDGLSAYYNGGPGPVPPPPLASSPPQPRITRSASSSSQVTSHSDGTAGSQQVVHARQLMPRDGSGRKICFYYNFGGCTNGPGCPFAHAQLNAPAMPTEPVPPHWQAALPPGGYDEQMLVAPHTHRQSGFDASGAVMYMVENAPVPPMAPPTSMHQHYLLPPPAPQGMQGGPAPPPSPMPAPAYATQYYSQPAPPPSPCYCGAGGAPHIHHHHPHHPGPAYPSVAPAPLPASPAGGGNGGMYEGGGGAPAPAQPGHHPGPYDSPPHKGRGRGHGGHNPHYRQAYGPPGPLPAARPPMPLPPYHHPQGSPRRRRRQQQQQQQQQQHARGSPPPHYWQLPPEAQQHMQPVPVPMVE